MANYAQAALLTAQARLNKKYNEAEMRSKLRPVVALGLKNQDYAIPGHVELKKGEQRPVEVHYLTKKAPGASTVKATRHTGGKGDSAKLALSWSRLTETFSFSRKLAFNKVIGAQEMFNNEVEQAISNLHDRMETQQLAYLVANRCQMLAANIKTSGAGTWIDATKHLQISAANKDYFMQQVKTFMFGRFHRGEFDMIADLIQYPVFERVMNQGAGNSTNTSFQFGDANIVPTTDTILASLTNGSALVIPKGNFAIMPWNDKLNRDGFGRQDDYVGMFTTMADPFGLPLSYDISVYTDRADTSGIDGHVQDIVDQYEISVSLGSALPPLSEANDSVVHLVANI